MGVLDVVILGAGIAGASLAWRLAGRRSVLMLERESQPGYHSTGRSAAMFMESYGPPGVRALTRASRAFYEHPPAGFTVAPLMSPRGVLYVANTGQQQLLAELRLELSAACPALADWSADMALARVPVLRRECLLSALWEPDACDLDVHALHQGFLRGARQRGAALRVEAQITEARRVDGLWQLHHANVEPTLTRAVVNASGAWGDELATMFGAAPVGLVPKRRSAFTFAAPAGAETSVWPCIVAVDESCYFKPDAGRLLGSPANADPTVPHDVVPEELDIAMGIHAIEAVTTMSIRRPASTWAGLRSFVADGELVMGWDRSCPGFFWLVGQGGYGIQSAAAASELAAALICGEVLPEALVQHGVEPRVMSPERLR